VAICVVWHFSIRAGLVRHVFDITDIMRLKIVVSV
jgi:hypothetical protein